MIANPSNLGNFVIADKLAAAVLDDWNDAGGLR